MRLFHNLLLATSILAISCSNPYTETSNEKEQYIYKGTIDGGNVTIGKCDTARCYKVLITFGSHTDSTFREAIETNTAEMDRVIYGREQMLLYSISEEILPEIIYNEYSAKITATIGWNKPELDSSWLTDVGLTPTFAGTPSPGTTSVAWSEYFVAVDAGRVTVRDSTFTVPADTLLRNAVNSTFNCMYLLQFNKINIR